MRKTCEKTFVKGVLLRTLEVREMRYVYVLHFVFNYFCEVPISLISFKKVSLILIIPCSADF